MTQLILAIVLGTMFGFIMHRSGIANPERIINMLRLKDFHLMKVIFFAVGFSSFVVLALVLSGVIEQSHVHIKPAYLGVLIGGALFGLGFAISGYCPGTCVVGAGAQRKDALIFLAGGLVGALLFTFTYDALSTTWIFQDIAGTTTVTDHLATQSVVSSNLSLIIAAIMSAAFFALAYILPNKKL